MQRKKKNGVAQASRGMRAARGRIAAAKVPGEPPGRASGPGKSRATRRASGADEADAPPCLVSEPAAVNTLRENVISELLRAQENIFAAVEDREAPFVAELERGRFPQKAGRLATLRLKGMIIDPWGIKVGAYLGPKGTELYLAALLPMRPAELVGAVASMYTNPDYAEYDILYRKNKKCDRCCAKAEAGKLGGIGGGHSYYVCEGGCTAELALSIFVAQSALSRLDALLPWAPLLIAAHVADSLCDFALLNLDILYKVVTALPVASRGLPTSCAPPWAWSPST